VDVLALLLKIWSFDSETCKQGSHNTTKKATYLRALTSRTSQPVPFVASELLIAFYVA
jgi:hypothetical protein